ncbi:Helix-turn-helix domain-containing protein [Chryseolinea serpens]|uniref:Helix-turn-helix domain-containing protein n=1 Tax=Chryseolinea serpens TaxID=947013 RepID=A0A1M5S9S3_9BACT|nr:helix-turn-helix domain-containing protein [Chryseolinea serpens]SHH35028.1 Helix-turn-helix domain-containing protein [Chryseolinea serpens]
MKVEKYIPTPALRSYIKAFMIVASDGGMENRILPSTSMVMAFRLAGDIAITEQDNTAPLPTSIITGLRKTPRLVRYEKGAATLLVIFEEGGASAWFRESLHEWFGSSVGLEDIVRRDRLRALEEQLMEATNNRQRIALVEQFLLSTKRQAPHDPLVLHAVQTIQQAKGDIRIATLMDTLPISRDPFEKRFRKIVGTSPKHFSSLVRLRALIDNYSTHKSLTYAGHAAGYFDQAHFIKDFKTFTGLTPHDFFKIPPHW